MTGEFDICNCGYNRSAHPQDPCDGFQLLMTQDEQEATSRYFDRSISVNLLKLSSGRFALFQIKPSVKPFWIGEGDNIAEAYAARPEFIPRAHVPKRSTIDISAIDFDL